MALISEIGTAIVGLNLAILTHQCRASNLAIEHRLMVMYELTGISKEDRPWKGPVHLMAASLSCRSEKARLGAWTSAV